MVWIVTIPSLISSSPCLFSRGLRTIPRVPNTINITAIFLFNSFCISLARSWYFFFYFFYFHSLVNWNVKIHLFFINTRSNFLARIRWSICISKSLKILCIIFSRTYFGLCINCLSVQSILISRTILCEIIPTQSCQVLYFFCENLLHSLML